MQVTRANPRAAPLFLLSGVYAKSTLESWAKMKELMGAKWDAYRTAVEAAVAKHPELKAIPVEDLIAVHAYTAEEYKTLNTPLRYPFASIPDLLKNEAYINAAINGLTQLPAYKGTVTRIQTTLIDPALYFKGNTVEMRGFTSTSMLGGKAPMSGMVRFSIESVNGRIVEKVAKHASEKEVLFLPGTKFLITDITPLGAATLITMKEVP